MNANLFTLCLRHKFLDEMQGRPNIGTASAPVGEFRCDHEVLIMVPIRDIEDDCVITHRNQFIMSLRGLLDGLPRFEWDVRQSCIHLGDVYYRSEIRFGTDAGTPSADIRRAIQIWVSVRIQALPFPPAEIVWQTVGDASPRPQVPHYAAADFSHMGTVPKTPAEPEQPIELADLAAELTASLDDAVSLKRARFNAEGGFSDN